MKSDSKPDLIPNYCYGTVSKRSDLQTILAEVKSWGTLPAGWKMTVAESSVYLSNERRTKSIKVDVYRTVYTDKVVKGSVVSVKHQCTSLTATLEYAKEHFDIFTKKKNEPKIESKGELGKITPKRATKTRAGDLSSLRIETQNPSWWVLV